MSSSSNLYSADDSDRDSFSDELTPTDGYFNGQRMSLNRTVQDPSVEDSKPEPKTLIAPPHLRSIGGAASGTSHGSSSFHPSSPPVRRALSPSPINTSSQHVAYSPSSSGASTPTQDMYSEESPLVSGPPPAYSPNPTSPLVSGPGIEHRYSTFPQEERGFVPARAPQSMGGPSENIEERVPLIRQPRSPLHRTINAVRNSAGKSIIVLLIFIGAFVTLTHFATKQTLFPGNPTNPGKLPIKDAPSNDKPVDVEGPYCTAARLKDDEMVFEFATGAELSVIQTTHESEGYASISTVGVVRLRTIPKDSKHGNKPYFSINSHISDPELEVIKTWDQASMALTVSTPRTASLSPYGRHCISLEIEAWFPEGSRFTNLVVQAISLDMTIMDDIKVYSEKAKFSTVSGDIYFPNVSDDLFYKDHTLTSRSESSSMVSASDYTIAPFSSRNILIETISGDIKGTYPLKDLLGLSSQSGDIHVKVLPAPADDTAPAPADLEIQTSSGGIQASLPLSNAGYPSYVPPPRRYITRVHSNSGDISGSYYLGSESTFKTNSGGIHLDTLPILQSSMDNSFKNIFDTHTLSGSTSVDIAEPIFIKPLSTPSVGSSDPYHLIPIIEDKPLFTIDSRASTEKLKSLKSHHATTSGSIRAHYPEAWKGTLHGKAVSGNVEFKGEGLRIIKARKGPGFVEVLAQRGVEDKKDGSTVEMNSISGSLNFGVGATV